MKSIFNRFLSVLCLLFVGIASTFAERISLNDAALVANNFMNVPTSQSGVRKSVADKRMVLKTAPATQEENQFYVYENANGEGWVMVAANDIAHPILAYSDEGQFRFDNQPSNVKCWLGKYNKQIKQAEENGVLASEEVTQEWKQLRKQLPSGLPRAHYRRKIRCSPNNNLLQLTRLTMRQTITAE